MFHDDRGQHEYLEGEERRQRRSLSRIRPAVAYLLFSIGLAAVVWSASSSSSGTGRATTVASLPSTGATGVEADALISGWRRIAYRAVEQQSDKASTTTSTLAAKPVAASSVDSRSAAADTINRRVTPEGSQSYGCPAAYAWLEAHAAPGFRFICPGYALGHQAMSCDDVAGVCPGEAVIVIAVPCPAAYMNEAHNSWIVAGLTRGSFDPYGYCH